MSSKSGGLEEALLANMDDLGSIEIDSGEETPSATAAIQTGEEDQTATDAAATTAAAPATQGADSDISTSALAQQQGV
jgi:hypothetical protein